MSKPIQTNARIAAQFTSALFGSALGYADNKAFIAELNVRGISATLNKHFKATFAGTTTPQSIATTVVTNLLGDAPENVDFATKLTAYIKATVTTKIIAGGYAGQTIATILAKFASGGFGAQSQPAVDLWNATVTSNLAYSTDKLATTISQTPLDLFVTSTQQHVHDVYTSDAGLAIADQANVVTIVQATVTANPDTADAQTSQLSDANTALNLAITNLAAAQKELQDASQAVIDARAEIKTGIIKTQSFDNTGDAAEAQALVNHASVDVLAAEYAVNIAKNNLSVAIASVVNDLTLTTCPTTSALESVFTVVSAIATTDAINAQSALSSATAAWLMAKNDLTTTIALATQAVVDATAAVAAAAVAAKTAAFEKTDAKAALTAASAVQVATGTARGLTTDATTLASTQLSAAGAAVSQANADNVLALNAATKAAAQLLIAQTALATVTTNYSFILTTGIDQGTAFVGTSGINNFFAGDAAVYAGVAPTWTIADKIDGGLGNDTFTVAQTAGIAGVPVGATVVGIETANMVSAGSITLDTTGTFTGLTTLNVTAGGVSTIKVAATTDVNELTSIDKSTITGGKNVVINHTDSGAINLVTALATTGALDITSAKGNVVVGTEFGAILPSAAKFALGTVAVKMSATEVLNAGNVTIDGGTTIAVTATGAIAADVRAAHSATAAAANLVSNTAGNAGTAFTADTKASLLATALTTLAGNYAAANLASDEVSENNTLSFNELDAGTITLADKVAIDSAYFNAFTAIDGTATKAQAAALLVIAPLAAAATTANGLTANALLTAKAATVAAEAVVTADGLVIAAVNAITVAAIHNTALTSVSLTGAGDHTNVLANKVTDGSTFSNTLTTVTLNNVGDTDVTGKALANVFLSNSVANDDVDVSLVNTTVGNALTVSVNNNVDLFLTVDTGNTTTLNLVLAGTNQFTDFNARTETAINITGAGNLDANSTPGNSGFVGNADVVINAIGATGNISLELGNTGAPGTFGGQSYLGGSGVDTISTNGGTLQTAIVSGGAGTADKLILRSAADFATTGAAKYTNFEVLQVGTELVGGAAITADITKFIGSTFTSVVLDAGAAVTGLNVTQAAHLTVRASGSNIIGVKNATAFQIDTVSIDVNDGSAAVNTIALGTPVLTGVEKLNLTATDNLTIADLTSATALTNVNVTGAGIVSITSAAVAVNVNTAINASAVNSAVTLDFSVGLSNGVALSAGNGDNTLKGTDIATKDNWIVSGNGNSTLTGGQADDVITAGNGNNTIHGAAGANIITAGNGNNTIDVVGSVGANTINVGNGFNNIIGGTGNDVITVGTGGNVIDAGAGADVIVLAAHAASVIDAITGGVSVANTAATVTAGGVANGNTLTFGNGVDVISGFNTGSDTLDLAFDTAITGNGVAAAATLTAQNYLISGAWNATTGIFTVNTTTGADTLIVKVAVNANAFGLVVGGTQDSDVVLVGVSSVGAANINLLDIAII